MQGIETKSPQTRFVRDRFSAASLLFPGLLLVLSACAFAVWALDSISFGP